MHSIKRIFYFLLTNLLVITTISITLNILGVRPYLSAAGIDYVSLMIFCLVWGMGGAFISLAMSRSMAKWMMGVRVISEDVTDGESRELMSVVTRLAQAAGVPMPQVGIYESREVNAFATGPTKRRSLVAVSRGLLQRLNSDEVEGVLAHELAHIANGDMVTMTLIQGVINAFVMFFARVIAWAVVQRFSDNEGGSHGLQFLVTIVLEIFLSLLGWLVVAYFSRTREFRADAGAAMTAGKGKMIAALEKLQATKDMVARDEHQALATLKIAGKKSTINLWSTHPPLAARIEALKSL